MTAYFPAPVCEGTVHVPFFAVIGKRLAMSNARCSRVVIMSRSIRDRSRIMQLVFACPLKYIVGMTKRKNPAAVALGRKGGKKGGPARAAAMTAKERSEAARRAVTVRWEKAKTRSSNESG